MLRQLGLLLERRRLGLQRRLELRRSSTLS
jgi:hypothetical protein